MATEPTPLEKARAVAAEAQAAQRAQDAAQVECFDTVKNIKQFNVGTYFQHRQHEPIHYVFWTGSLDRTGRNSR